MATQETQLLDDVIVAGRRKMMALGGSALAGIALAGITPKAHAATATYSDADILNFALNLEYLEANFYYMAAFGTTITASNSYSQAAGALTINLTGTVGTTGNINVAPITTGATRVPFTTAQVQSYAIETAVEEGKHVNFLLNALGTTLAVGQPLINISTATFQALAAAANSVTPAGNIPSTFSPYANDAAFLVGAYIFEDVGVTAYHGAASLITSSANLTAAAGILAVEAYHAGLVRTSINAAGSSTYVGYTTSISNLRNYLAQAALLGASGGSYDPSPDDFGLATQSVSIGALTGQPATQITDASENGTSTYAIATARNTAQVLNIVTGGGKVSGSALVTPAKGVFFPNGLNAGPNGFN